MGSSPRVRGSLTARPPVFLAHGIIPAGAGLTCSSPAGYPSPWDHPRGCGAHLELLSFFDVLMGSSPRVRGSLAVLLGSQAEDGIIPAGAGLTI